MANILIGVTGSIAIYKSLELIRLFTKSGDNVKVIMTNSAKKFLIDSNQTIRYAMKKLEEIVESGMESLYVIEHNKLI